MNMFAYEPFKSRISILCSSRILLVLIPIDFQNQTFWGACLSGAGPQGWGAWYEAQSLLSLKKRSVFGGSLLLGGNPVWLLLPPFLMHLVSFVVEATVYLVLRSFSEENYSICSCKPVVSLGRGEFRVRVFLCYHLEPLFTLTLICISLMKLRIF